jgi:hypothetical protein
MSAKVHKLCKRPSDLVLQIKRDNANATQAELGAIFHRMMTGPYRHLESQVLHELFTHYVREFAAEGNANAVKLLARERHKKKRTMTVEVEHKPQPRRTMTVEVERSK